jgi:hypothetical protein
MLTEKPKDKRQQRVDGGDGTSNVLLGIETMETRNGAVRWGAISVIVGCFTVLIGVSLLSNMFLTGNLGSPPFAETNLERLHQFDQMGEYLTAALGSVDQLVSMLTTVQLSLFVLVGVGFRKALDGTQRLSTPQIAIGAIFLIFAFNSLTLGYAARMQMARLIWLATDSFDSVRATLVHEAIFVILSAAAAICALVIPFIERSDGSTLQSSARITDVPIVAIGPEERSGEINGETG